MKYGNLLILSVCVQFFVSSSTVFARDPGRFTVISDVDDTLKITNVPSYGDSLENLFFGKTTFLGMAQVFQALYRHTQSFIYLSGAPQSTQERAHEVLIHLNQFPEGAFLFSNWFEWKSTYDFKSGELKKIAAEKDEPFVLLGDDTQSDPEVFQTFQAEHGPGKAPQAYVHQITRREIPAQLIPYLTSFDLALHEVEAEHLTPEEAASVGSFILSAHRPEELIPSFQHCPTEITFKLGKIAMTHPALVQISKEVEQLVRGICQARILELPGA